MEPQKEDDKTDLQALGLKIGMVFGVAVVLALMSSLIITALKAG